MAEFLINEGLGLTFWTVLAALTVMMIVAGIWLGGVIGRKTDSGVGAFFIHLLVTFMVAGGVLPLVMFFGVGDLISSYDFEANNNVETDPDLLYAGIGKILKALSVAGLSVLCFFVAGLIGIARGRSAR